MFLTYKITEKIDLFYGIKQLKYFLISQLSLLLSYFFILPHNITPITRSNLNKL